jgi:3'(2'), 5'-bisphosphate nucleotidase
VSEQSYSRELETAIRLARSAGALALRYRDGDLRVELKPGDEPVTVADRKASELIVSGLHSAFPGDIVISEEAADDQRRLTAPRVWYIDPIDGTKDFIHGREGFSVMIGLSIDGVPQVGVVYQPVGDRLFRGAPDTGTWFVAADQPPRLLAVSETDDMNSIRLVASRSHREGIIDEVKSALNIRDEFNIGSVGLKLGLISLGERDLYVNPSPRCKFWDTCAPEAILRHAGGRFTDLYGQPLAYRSRNTHHTRGLVASNGRLHEQVIAKLAPLFANRDKGD